jgi:hypothetical protein
LRVRWQRFGDGTKHLRARCPGCNHLRYLPQTDLQAAALADSAPGGEQQGTLFDAA